MCGAFTDNQPDFSWLMPGEEKQFTQIFMPYKGIGGAKNANKDVVVNFDVENGVAKVGVYLTQPRHVNVCLESRTFADESHIALYTTIFAENVSLSPAQAYVRNIGVSDMDLPAFRLRVSENGRNLIEYVPTSKTVDDIPSPASPAKSPSELTSNEELFINGLHLEQYRHANTASEPYYLEALKRDPLDSRCNNALGLLHFRRGRFATAEAYFRNAIISLTRRNPNPYDGEAYYNLGLCLKMLQRPSEAFDALYKAVWNAAWQASAYYELACLANRHFADPAQALELTQQALRRNVSHHKARHLQIALLRHDGRLNEAQKALDAALELDPMEMGALREKQYLNENKSSEFTAIARGNANLYLEIALDYANAGLFDSAIELLNEAIALPETRLKNALLSYHIAHFFLQKGQMSNAKVQYEKASQQPSDYCFPHHLESVLALQSAIELNPADARAPYYLGNFWYAHRQYELAISNWEHARDLDPKFATVWRNLGLAYCNKLQDLSQAQIAYQTAFALNLNDSRVLFELDQLEKKCNCSQTDRLARLEQYSQLVDERDDLSIERITMLSTLGYFDKAYDLIMARQFHPWEGGEGKVTSQFVLCLVERAKQLIKNGAFDVAIAQLHLALTRPHNLGEGRLPNAQENNIYYHLGVAYDQNGNKKLAQECYVKAAQGMSEPSSAMFYNDQPPDMIYFQGLARQKLGNETDARLIFNTLVEYGLKHLDDEVKLDYFAVSYPTFGVFDDDLNLRNRVHCHYMLCLGYKGLGDVMTAQSHFDHILKLDNSHQGGLVIKD
jgi:tetratricopeptide (TPR) repeat protein